jgi:hypothetical protein
MLHAKGAVLQRNWVAIGAWLAFGLAGALAASFGTRSLVLGVLAAALGAVFAGLFYARNAFPRALPATILATEVGLSVDPYNIQVRSEEILEAKVVPRNDLFAVVELALRGGRTLQLELHLAEAQALLDVFGARRSRFQLVVPLWKRWLSAVVVLLALTAWSTGRLDLWVVSLPSCLVMASLAAWLVGYVRGRLVVGADGFTRHWLSRRRFVPFAEVAEVRGRPHFLNRGVEDTEIVLRSGETLRLRTVEAPNTELERGAEGRAMLSHVRLAFERGGRPAEAVLDVPALVDRGGRTPREWLAGLDALVRGGATSYRVAPVSASALVDLAEDPGASLESRVGAAAALTRLHPEALLATDARALAARGDAALTALLDTEELRTRIRVSAEACAEPELRGLLLALADARDEAATEATLARAAAASASLPARRPGS